MAISFFQPAFVLCPLCPLITTSFSFPSSCVQPASQPAFLQIPLRCPADQSPVCATVPALSPVCRSCRYCSLHRATPPAPLAPAADWPGLARNRPPAGLHKLWPRLDTFLCKAWHWPKTVDTISIVGSCWLQRPGSVLNASQKKSGPDWLAVTWGQETGSMCEQRTWGSHHSADRQ